MVWALGLSNDPSGAELLQCSAINDDHARLVCYDNLNSPRQPAKGALGPLTPHSHERSAMNDSASSSAPNADIAVPAKAPEHHVPSASFWELTLGSIGVVYGDIGTSPLYALREFGVGRGRSERIPPASLSSSASSR